jgi:hypothetical protein
LPFPDRTVLVFRKHQLRMGSRPAKVEACCALNLAAVPPERFSAGSRATPAAACTLHRVTTGKSCTVWRSEARSTL